MAKDEVTLTARTIREAKAEISLRWPTQDVAFKGLARDGQVVFMSMVRKRGGKGYIATATRNRSIKPVSFVADVEEA